MKNTIVTGIFLCLSSLLFSQSGDLLKLPSGGLSLKLNTAVSGNFESVLQYKAAPIIPGIMIQTSRGNLHQLELLQLTGNLRSTLPNSTIDGFSVGFRYEYAWYLAKLKASLWKPFLGFGVLESFSSWITKPEISAVFSQRDRNNLVRLSVVPSLQYALADRIFLDFSLPISFFELQTEEKLSRSAPLGGSIDISKSNQADFYLIRDIGLRFGIGFRL